MVWPDGRAARPITMREVATRAGVAVSTVSRVMSSPDRISADTRDRVLRAARELGYRTAPRAVGVGLGARVDGVGSVAVLVADITNPFYFDLIRGAQERLRTSGYTQLLIDTEESAAVEESYLRQFSGAAVGAILAASRLTDAAIAAFARSLPLVTVNRPIPGVSGVIIDTGSGAREAMQHLIDLGHDRICYIAGPDSSWSNRRRWETCQTMAAASGVEIVRIGPFPPRTSSGAAAADALLHVGAAGAIVFNDLIAIGMLQRLTARGVHVPDDVSVVGCDDIFGADFCSPPLTTLTAPIRRAGREATNMLLDTMLGLGHSSRSVTLPVHLTVRESSAPSPARRSASPGRQPR